VEDVTGPRAAEMASELEGHGFEMS
jgi:hypothetical protein